MKKILYAFLGLILLAAFVAVSPIIGNGLVESYIEDEIKSAKQKGITLEFKNETPGYLYTSRQYEFILTDVDAFASYLTEYGAGLLPPYTDELLKSIVFRLDMRYNNIPFLEPISIDIYPMYLSNSMMDRFDGSNNVFFKNFRQFIRRQGLLYHLDYNLLSEDYSGEIKNVDYKERDFDGSNILLTLHNAVFNGSGSFKAPKSLEADIEKMMLKTSDASKEIEVQVNKFSSQSNKDISKVAEEIYDKSKQMYKDSGIKEKVEEIKEEGEDAMREMYNTSMQMQSMFFGSKDKTTNEKTEFEAEDVNGSVSHENTGKKSSSRSYFFFGN